MAEICVIRINSAPVNALSTLVREKLLNDFHSAWSNSSTKVIVLVGIEGFFSAGADVKELDEFHYAVSVFCISIEYSFIMLAVSVVVIRT